MRYDPGKGREMAGERLQEALKRFRKRYYGPSRMSTALRQLADRVDGWRRDRRPERREKDERLVGVLR